MSNQVKSFMRTEVTTVTESTTVLEATQLMSEKNIGAVIVMGSNNQPVGIFTERDLLKRVVSCEKPATTEISNVMTPKFMCINENDELSEVASVMIKGNFRHLPVVQGDRPAGTKIFAHRQVENDHLVGILSVREILKSFG